MEYIDLFPKKVLFIDLSTRKWWTETREDLFENYLGGTGVATKLLEENLDPNCDPLSPDNVIIFATGPLNALYPVVSKTVAMFKSPHTGNIGESHCGGRTSAAFRLTGYGAVVIKGKSDIPVYLVISPNKVAFRDARSIWGMRSTYTVGKIIRRAERGAGIRTIMRIGRAGEKMVTYSSVVAESYRHFGRLGLGAVFGSKNLKAIVVEGSGSIKIPEAFRRSYNKTYKKIYDLEVNSDLMKKYHDLGTPANILNLNKRGALPSYNLKSTTYPFAEELSGEKMASDYLGRRLACSHCPVACIHLGILRESYENEPYFYKTTYVSYDYELIYSCGTMLGIKNGHDLLKVIDAIEVAGLDAMSGGVVLAWITEAFEKGIISEKETLNATPKWGEADEYVKIIENIVEQPNDFYKLAARGVESLSDYYGGKDFALAFGKNEMPGYHTGYAAHLGWTLGARHSHLDNAGYSIDQKLKEIPSPEELVDKIIEEECWRQLLTSLAICLFARGIYKPEIVAEAFNSLGKNLDEEQLRNFGRKIYAFKYHLKQKLGFSFDKLRIPERIFETPSMHGKLEKSYIDKALKYAADKIQGIIKQHLK